MNNESDPSKPAKIVKLGRGQIRCFHCKNVCTSRQGEWVKWKEMEAYLCHACELLTRETLERR